MRYNGDIIIRLYKSCTISTSFVVTQRLVFGTYCPKNMCSINTNVLSTIIYFASFTEIISKGGKPISIVTYVCTVYTF